MKINKEAFEKVCEELEDDTKGNHLKFEHIGEIFGQPFWIMLVGSLMDARDSARIFQAAYNRIGQLKSN